MLTLIFGTAEQPAPAVKRGPFREVRADGERLRDGEDGPIIALHEDHAWFIGRQRFFRIDCEGPVRVHFEDANGKWSEEYGPFFHFSSADGMAYADGEILAHVDPDDSLWYCHRNEVAWREMVVVPAG